MKNQDHTQEFRFKYGDSIGAADAEDDTLFLSDCFVDTGAISIITNTNDPKFIVVGRTGSGKTALLLRIKETFRNANELSLTDLAVEQLTTSPAIRLAEKAGANLDPYFKLFWKEIFIVELLKSVFRITNEPLGMTRAFSNYFADRAQEEEARKFLLEHKKIFEMRIDERVKEIKDKTERELKGSIGSISKASGSQKITIERTHELRDEVQEVLRQLRPPELKRMQDILKSELTVTDEKHFIIIDKIDESWADESIKYKLIYALIETVRDFRKNLPNTKIIICLRTDLIERIMRYAEGPHTQDEKTKSLLLNLTWNINNLTELLDKRINHLIKHRYTKGPISYSDIFPEKIKEGSKNKATIEYFLERTAMRPRDLITFFNYCIQLSSDKPKITQDTILKAEGSYSRSRIRSLEQEWKLNYPHLHDIFPLFENKPTSFRISSILQSEVEESLLKYASKFENSSPEDDISSTIFDYVNQKLDFPTAIIKIIYNLYVIGFLAIKPRPTSSYHTIDMNETIEINEVSEDTTISVHKMYWNFLQINHKGR